MSAILGYPGTWILVALVAFLAWALLADHKPYDELQDEHLS